MAGFWLAFADLVLYSFYRMCRSNVRLEATQAVS